MAVPKISSNSQENTSDGVLIYKKTQSEAIFCEFSEILQSTHATASLALGTITLKGVSIIE